MNLEINKYQEIAEVSVSGSIDELGAEKMEQCFSDIDPLAIKHVVLDFGSIDYIGSAGVGTLLLLYKKLAPARWRCAYKKHSPGFLQPVGKRHESGAGYQAELQIAASPARSLWVLSSGQGSLPCPEPGMPDCTGGSCFRHADFHGEAAANFPSMQGLD
jgi:anti-anti-sigma factor